LRISEDFVQPGGARLDTRVRMATMRRPFF